MFMKKWQLKVILEDGRRWNGFINTVAEKEEDFPETITGTFWTSCDETGCRGNFELGDGNYTSNYVMTSSMKGKEIEDMYTGDSNDFYNDSKRVEAFMESQRCLPTWERIERKIEDCLNIEDTYIMKFGSDAV